MCTDSSVIGFILKKVITDSKDNRDSPKKVLDDTTTYVDSSTLQHAVEESHINMATLMLSQIIDEALIKASNERVPTVGGNTVLGPNAQ